MQVCNKIIRRYINSVIVSLFSTVSKCRFEALQPSFSYVSTDISIFKATKVIQLFISNSHAKREVLDSEKLYSDVFSCFVNPTYPIVPLFLRSVWLSFCNDSDRSEYDIKAQFPPINFKVEDVGYQITFLVFTYFCCWGLL